MTQFIDRRTNAASKKSTVNRQRFLKRYKQQIKKAVADAIEKRSIKNVDKGEEISISNKDLSEPKFQFGKGGKKTYVLPGNDQFLPGDKIAKNKTGSQSDSSDAGNSNETGEDSFIFQLSRDEFLDLYFEDLELPDLIKKELARIQTMKTIRSGITSSGLPNNLHILKSMRQSTGRRIALSANYKKELLILEDELKNLQKDNDSNKNNIQNSKIEALKARIIELKKKIKAIPFIDDFDLRYRSKVQVPSPSTQAVMFCVMDVSGSMDAQKKELAKRFFILLYLFLHRNYKKIEVVFIKHHTAAKEVDEEDFFYSRETGGTVVSSALELLDNIITTRFSPESWNIYVAQASDGDNWNADSPHCYEILNSKIMPLVQYFAYIEIMPRHHQSLWDVYEQLKDKYPQFAMRNIDSINDIYPVFHELFKKKGLA